MNPQQEILVGVMPLGEHNPRCCKTRNCLSSETSIRKGRKAWKGTSKFRKQTWASLNNTQFFSQYQELTTTCLPFQKGTALTGYEKIFQNKIRLNLRTLCQYRRKESSKVITGSRTHTQWEGSQASSHVTWCAENLPEL